MKEFFVYFRIQLKRSARYLPFVFLVTFTLCLVLMFALTAMVNSGSRREEQSKLSVGIVGDPGDTYLNFGLSALKSLDSSRFTLDIVALDETEAKKALENREIAGYAVIPDGFISDALYGDVGKITFVTSSTSADVVSMFKQELLSLVSCILVESQNGVYGVQDAMAKYELERSDINKQTDVMMAEYIGMILNRANAIELKIVGVSDSLTFGGYIFCGFSILFMLLSGIVTCPLCIRRDMSLSKLLRTNGYSVYKQIAGEYLSFFLLMLVNTMVILFAAMTAVSGSADLVTELWGLSVNERALTLLKFIPAVALITAMQFFLYQLSDSLVGGALMQFVCAVFLGYISGCFYPIGFFPPLIQKLSLLVPPGMVRAYLASALTSNAGIAQVAPVMLYFAVLLAGAGFVRYKRLQTA